METAINQITILAAAILGILILVLVVVYFYLGTKQNKKTEKGTQTKTDSTSQATSIPKESIYKFMEFDKVEDNMIIQNGGTKFIMAIECQGVNYDLMSEMEQVSVEEGFIQFLNTLRSRVQIYVQTRTINLEDSINNYKQRTDAIEKELTKNKMLYDQMIRLGNYKQENLDKLNYEIVRQENLVEYGADIINYTEKMSLNRSVLQKQYYIIIPYHSAELGNEEFTKEEIRSLAFSELYTRAQGIIRSIASCGVIGNIMSSYDLMDLLYVAYNRDEEEVYGLNKALMAGYDELYATGEDVLEKRAKKLNEQIEKEALQLAIEKAKEAKNNYTEEEDINELIKRRAKEILEENKDEVGAEIADSAIESIDNDETEDENNEEDYEDEDYEEDEEDIDSDDEIEEDSEEEGEEDEEK